MYMSHFVKKNVNLLSSVRITTQKELEKREKQHKTK